MNRHPCSGCGDWTCDGRCYDESASDYPPEEETVTPRAPYVPSPEYLAWCAEIDTQLTQTKGDPFLNRKSA